MKRIKKIVSLVFAPALLGLFLAAGTPADDGQKNASLDLAMIREIVPQAKALEMRDSPFTHYLIYENPDKQTPAGYAFVTTDVTPAIRGYGGAIKILVATDPHWKVLGIKVLEHAETPDIMQGILQAGWLEQFRGLDPRSDFVTGKDLDAVSGATITASAIARSVRESLKKMAGTEPPADPYADDPGEMTDPKMSKRAREIQKVLKDGSLVLTPAQYYRRLGEEKP